jgi:hypothetical protein
MNPNASALTEKIQSLSVEEIVEVEDFVEFVRLRGEERGLTRGVGGKRSDVRSRLEQPGRRRL